jgi:hypothetical protein
MNERRVELYFWFLTIISIVWVGFNQPRLFGTGSDEGYYTAYASIFSQTGFSCFPKLLNLYWANSKAQYFPPPTRLGYIIPVGYLYHLWPSIRMLVFFSFTCYVGSLAVSLHFSKKFLDKIYAYAFVALLAASPLLMAMARRALIDSLLFLLWTTILWLCTDYVINKSKGKLVGICLLLMYSLTIKESTVVIIPFILMCCWMGRDNKTWPWKEWFMVLGAFFLGFWFIPGSIVGFGLWTKSMWNLLFLQKSVFTMNPYIERYCQGPWFRYLLDACLLSPVVTLLAMGFCGFMILQKNFLKLPMLWFLFFVIVYSPLILLQKNIRYVMSLEIVYCFFAIMAFFYFAQRFQDPQTKRRILILGISLIIVSNWCLFDRIFVEYGLLDPISFHLLTIEKFIPG